MDITINKNDIISGEKLQYLCDITIITRDIYNFHKSLDKNITTIFIDDNNIDIDYIKKSEKIYVYTHILDQFESKMK